jgi:hypothetical protein
MNYEKGHKVWVKDYSGKHVAMKVWEDRGRSVFVASEEMFDLLEACKTELWPIGVPKSDVSIRRQSTNEVTSIMPSAEPVKIEKPISFDDAMRKAMRVPPEKKTKPKVRRKKRR